MNCKRLLALVLLPLLAICSFAQAQDKMVTGKVTDAKDGSALQGISVMQKGTKNATQTNAEGVFKIKVTSGAVLVFSSVNYASIEVSADAASLIKLTSVAASLSDVVVIGYGTAKKKDVTGSITTIGAKDFVKGAITTPDQLIAGKVAGVSITSNGGAPGAGSRIRIRGAASLSANNDPLIVIDGVPITSDGISGSANPLNMINPNDIESFNILKDASAAAIYGNRASNGVIIITTKKGKRGKPVYAFSSQVQISEVAKTVDVLSAAQYRTFVNTHGNSAQKALLGTAYTDWQKQIYQTSINVDNNLSASGSFKKVPYRFSLGYLNQTGVLKTGKFDRVSVGINLSPTVWNNHLKIDVNLKGINTQSKFAEEGAIGSAMSFDPTQPVSNGSKFGGYYEWLDGTNPNKLAPRNPLGQLMNRDNKSHVNRSIGNVQLDYKVHFLPDLRVNVNLGYDIAEGSGTDFAPAISAQYYTDSGTSNKYKESQRNLLGDFYLNYVKEVKSIKSRFDVMVGHSYQDFLITKYNFQSFQANGKPRSGSLPPQFPYDKPQNTLLSFYGRLNYIFNGRYYLTASVRRDGTSRFAKENRWGTFSAASLAWRISDEAFLKGNKVLTDLKLRVGFGQTGQENVGERYSYLSYYNLSGNNFTYQLGDSFYHMYKPGAYDPKRRWESAETYNAGLDFAFFKNRITGTVDVYFKKTSDLLSTVDVPAATNFSNRLLSNVGNMENKGFEININTIPIQNNNFSWEAGVNLTMYDTKLTKLTNVNDPNFVGNLVGGIDGGTGGNIQIQAVGAWPSAFYVYKQVYDKGTNKPIEGLYEDLNRDGQINEKDRYIYKRPEPTVLLGFTSNVSYKKWSAGFVMRGNFGNYMYNNVWSNTGTVNNALSRTDVINNTSSNVLYTNFSSRQLLSDYYVQNASFLRMDNFNIGYTVGKVMNNKANLRLSGNVQNVFVITKYKGIDPEIAGGIDKRLYPRPRIFVFSVNVDF